jgi:hypothetical protein
MQSIILKHRFWLLCLGGVRRHKAGVINTLHIHLPRLLILEKWNGFTHRQSPIPASPSSPLLSSMCFNSLPSFKSGQRQTREIKYRCFCIQNSAGLRWLTLRQASGSFSPTILAKRRSDVKSKPPRKLWTASFRNPNAFADTWSPIQISLALQIFWTKYLRCSLNMNRFNALTVVQNQSGMSFSWIKGEIASFSLSTSKQRFDSSVV